MGNKHPNKSTRSQSQQQALGGVKHCGVSRRYPRETKLRKWDCLDPKDLGLALLRVQTCVAVPGIAGLVQIDV
jgi:hypothetical protein